MDGIVGRANQGEILLFPIQHGITIEEIRIHSPSLAGLNMWNSSNRSPKEIAIEIADILGKAKGNEPSQIVTEPPVLTTKSEDAVGTRAFGTFFIAPVGTSELPVGAQPQTDPRYIFAMRGTPEGWIPVLDNNQELEYIIEDSILRIQLAYGSTRRGTEIAASQVMLGSQPFAVTIRKPDGSQQHFPAITNRSPSSFFMEANNPAGWLTFQIG